MLTSCSTIPFVIRPEVRPSSGNSPAPTSYETRLHYWTHINRAELAGDHAFAKSILQLYRNRFPAP